MSLIDDCYAAYVNMDHRTDRAEHMKAELLRVGLPGVKRHRGPRPEEWQGDPDRVKKILSQTPGALGCWMGQFSVMEEALARGQHAFVMEDDLIFCSDFCERMKVFQDFVASRSWDVFWLGGTFHADRPVWHPDHVDWEPTANARIVRTYGAFSTHAYIVNKTSISKIMHQLDCWMPDSVGIDGTFIKHVEPFARTYAFVPGMVKQRDNWSDIGKGMTIFSDFDKLGGHWWQDKMEDFDPSLLGTDARE